MNIKVDETKVVLSHNTSFHNYFGWPTVTRLRDGKLMLVTSGMRYQHVCPFGKCVGSVSCDEGKTWSPMMILIDTPLDDRDGGICAFGESNVIVTSFNNTTEFQRSANVPYDDKDWDDRGREEIEYMNAYLNIVDKGGEQEKYLGSTFIISHDNGVTFSEVKKIPVSSPHGPCELPDGTLLYVGRRFDANDGDNEIHYYKVYSDGSYEKLGEIEGCLEGALDCEPHAIVAGDKVIVHIRVQDDKGLFTTFQSNASLSDLKFSKPRQILSDRGGAPAHLLKHSSGALISTYGYRAEPFGVRAMISYDDGKTWSKDHVIYDNKGITADLGYPSSVELSDGRILTIYYAHPESARKPAVIMQTIWSIEE
ncbi:MAG: exo-alpha-sialidase [Clostridia bacterium]|nr:exo-alpha-sialidase [Clostridia bacterium]